MDKNKASRPITERKVIVPRNDQESIQLHSLLIHFSAQFPLVQIPKNVKVVTIVGTRM